MNQPSVPHDHGDNGHQDLELRDIIIDGVNGYDLVQTHANNPVVNPPGTRDARARDGSRGVAMSKAAFAGLKTLQELRFHLCQTSKGSEGVRNFLMSSYKNLKAASPTTPVLIREASGIEGKLYARYDYGVEKCVKLEGLDAKEVEKCLRDLVSSAP